MTKSCTYDGKCEDQPGFGGHLIKDAEAWGQQCYNKKYSRHTCPKTTEWFVTGGRCGWAHECKECKENI